MKNTTKTFAKIFLLSAIFTTTIFADGEMGTGGKTGGRTACVVNQSNLTDGEMGSGGKFVNGCQTTGDDSKDSILTTIKDYLASIFG